MLSASKFGPFLIDQILGLFEEIKEFHLKDISCVLCHFLLFVCNIHNFQQFSKLHKITHQHSAGGFYARDGDILCLPR